MLGTKQKKGRLGGGEKKVNIFLILL